MKQVKPKISIDKSVFTLNINGKKLSLSLEELKMLHSVIGSKIGGVHVYPSHSSYSPFFGSTTVATTNGSYATAVDSISDLDTNITLGEENE